MNNNQYNVCFFFVLHIFVIFSNGLENNITPENSGIKSNLRKISSKPNITNTVFNQSNTNIGWHSKTEDAVHLKDEVMLRMATPCETPNNDEGFCIPLKNCTKLLNQLQNANATDFLRKSRCGPKNDDNKNPKVCCGKYDNYKHLVKEDPLPKKCGYQNVITMGRIYGGKKAKLGEYPWMARLIHKNPTTNTKTFGCSGFLIAAKYVLTAGHCLKSENTEEYGPIFEVQLGEHNTKTEIDCNNNRTKCADRPQIIRVKKNIVHPNYRMRSADHHDDIGLIHLKKEAKFTDYVRPICLSTRHESDVLEYWLSGWGATEKNQLSNIKMKVSIPPFPHSNCTEKYFTINVNVIDKQICAGGIAHKDSCTGDSGGPLMVAKNGNHWFAAGVVSYGLGCGREGWPGVYTSIPSYMDWIKSTIIERATSKSKPRPKKRHQNKH